MKTYKFIITILFIIFLNISLVHAEECKKFDKLSKEYAKCTSDLLKDKTKKKAIKLKISTGEKIKQGKKMFNNSKLKEKIIKFKNSKSHKEFVEN
tara:strand:- start:246 stop:530 length:285 start_codon:yes stop_codon:yes gene_type:complete